MLCRCTSFIYMYTLRFEIKPYYCFISNQNLLKLLAVWNRLRFAIIVGRIYLSQKQPRTLDIAGETLLNVQLVEKCTIKTFWKITNNNFTSQVNALIAPKCSKRMILPTILEPAKCSPNIVNIAT